MHLATNEATVLQATWVMLLVMLMHSAKMLAVNVLVLTQNQ
jgi:hypothetical protein